MVNEDKRNKAMQIVSQLELIRNQIMLLKEEENRIRNTILTLNEIKKVEENSEFLLPIGGSILIKGKIVDKNKVLVDVGNGIFAYVDIDEAINILEEKIKNIENSIKNISVLEEKLRNELNKIVGEIKNGS